MSFSNEPFRHRPAKPSREVGDAPIIGSVPKMHTGHESRAGRRTSKVTGRGKVFMPSLNQGVTVFLVLFGITVVSLVGWIVYSQNKALTAATAPLGVVLPREEKTSAEIAVPTGSELEEIVRSFLGARTPEAVGTLIRKSEQPVPEILEKLAELEEVDGEISSVKYRSPLPSRALQLEAVIVNFKNGRNRLALLSPDDTGVWRVDFDGFDRYVSPPWEKLLSGEVSEGRVRIYVSKDSYYNGRFSDEKQWACFGIASPDNETLMFGYTPRGSAQFKAIHALLTEDPLDPLGKPKEGALKRAFVEIRHLPESAARQFEITRVLSDEWAMGEKAADELYGSD